MPDGKENNKATNVCPWHSGIVVEIKSMQKALDLARKELDRRLEGMNEFREQLRMQASTFVTRDTSEVHYKSIENRLRILENNKNNLEGRMWIIPAIIVLIQLAILIFKII